jgi:hypothetical protein
MTSNPYDVAREQGLQVTEAIPSGDPAVESALGDKSVTSVNVDELRWRITKEQWEKETDRYIRIVDKNEEIKAKENERTVKSMIIVILSCFALLSCIYAICLTTFSPTDNEAKANLNHQTADKVFALAVSGILAVIAGRGLK